MAADSTTATLHDQLHALLLARRQFEGNPDGALDEIEHRVRNMLSSEGLRFLGTFLGFKVYEDPTLKDGEFRVQNDAQITNDMLALEKSLSTPSAIVPTSEDAEKLVEEYDAALIDVYDDQNTRAAAREAGKRYEPVRQKLIAALSAKSATGLTTAARICRDYAAEAGDARGDGALDCAERIESLIHIADSRSEK